MAIIQFENGQEVEFDGDPTPEDVDFVAQQVGITPQVQAPQKSLLKKVGGFVGDITGAKGVYDVLKEGVTTKKPLKELIPRAAGSAAKVGLTLGSLGGFGAVGGLGTKVVQSAATGAAFSGAEAAEQGRVPRFGELATGAAVGGALPLAGKALGLAKKGLTEVLPRSLIKGALPGQTSTELSEHVLKNTKLGTTTSMLKNASNNISQLSNQIDDILKSSAQIISKKNLLNSVAKSYGQSGGGGTITSSEVEKLIQRVAPDVKGLLSRESLSLRDANRLRRAIDQALGDRFFLAKHTSFAKEVTGNFNSFLRDTVKSNAPQTREIFDELSKEIGLRNALKTAVKKSGLKLSLYDILGAMGGFSVAGPFGAAAGVGLERLAKEPAAGIGVAKGLSKLGQKAVPETAKRIFRTGVLSGQNKAF